MSAVSADVARPAASAGAPDGPAEAAAGTTRPVPLLRHLFSPLRINRLVMPNRVLMSSMHLNLDDLPDAHERMAAFYALRARESVGLIVTAGCGPNDAGRATKDGFGLTRDDEIDAHRLITRAVQAEGGRVALQILHFGREAFHGGIVSSSPERLPSSLFTPRPLDDGEILRTIADFADCAGRAVAAGYDAIELIFSQGFLVHQFLAPACNKRTDRWGGSFENRSRLALAVATAVRERVGPHYPLIFRLPCMDLLEGGLTPDESLALVELLRPCGIDLLNVSIGWHESTTPTIAMTVPRAAFASASSLVRRRFPDLLVATSNRINDPRTGEALLIAGDTDVVAMARPFLADPALVSKAERNDFDAINTCIACNQSCLDYVFTGQPVGCSVNPDCGLPGEGEYPALARQMSVAIAGGGIAGLGAALFAARRGARVVLFESAASLGGQLRMAARIPDKAEFAETVRYYEQAARRAGVEIRLGQPFDAAAATSRRWDQVLLAQGSAPRRPAGLPGSDLPQVLDFADVLERGCPVAFPVVVIGGGGVACDLAKFLLKAPGRLRQPAQDYLRAQPQAWEMHRYLQAAAATPAVRTAPDITLLQRSSRKFAHRVGRTTRWILTHSLQAAGVVMRQRTEVAEITAEGVVIIDHPSRERRLLPARTVVLAAGQQPNAGPEDLLRSLGIPHSVIGAARGADGGAGAGHNLTSALRAAHQWAMALA